MVRTFLASRNLFDTALLCAAVFVMPLISALAGRQMARRKPISLVPRYWQTLLRGWTVIAVLMAGWWWLNRPFADLGLSFDLGFWGKAGFGFVALAALALTIQLARIKSLTPQQRERAKKAFAGIKIMPNTRAELALFMLVAVSAGVWEELLYRGYLIWLLAPSLGTAGAIVFSSLAFGLGHLYQGPTGVAYTTTVGLVFAALFVATESLWWVMAAHALIDIYGGNLAFRMKRLMAQPA